MMSDDGLGLGPPPGQGFQPPPPPLGSGGLGGGQNSSSGGGGNKGASSSSSLVSYNARILILIFKLCFG